MNAKCKTRTKKENQLVSVEWFVPPLKGDSLCGGYNVNSIIVRQTLRVPGDSTAGLWVINNMGSIPLHQHGTREVEIVFRKTHKQKLN